MFRTIHLLKRKPGMTPQAFRDYYETRHRVLGEASANGHAVQYERHYLYPMNPGDAAPVFDVMMHLCFPDRATFERCIGIVADDPEKRQAFVEDELNLFDRPASLTFATEDVSSILPPVAPSDSLFRTIWFGRHRKGMTHAECRAYYENKHRLLGEYIMSGYAYNYDRHYLLPIAPGAPEPHYSFIMEMNFPSRTRFEEMASSIASDPALSRLLTEDEDRYVDRDHSVHYAAEIGKSVLAPLLMEAAE